MLGASLILYSYIDYYNTCLYNTTSIFCFRLLIKRNVEKQSKRSRKRLKTVSLQLQNKLVKLVPNFRNKICKVRSNHLPTSFWICCNIENSNMDYGISMMYLMHLIIFCFQFADETLDQLGKVIGMQETMSRKCSERTRHGYSTYWTWYWNFGSSVNPAVLYIASQ